MCLHSGTASGATALPCLSELVPRKSTPIWQVMFWTPLEVLLVSQCVYIKKGLASQMISDRIVLLPRVLDVRKRQILWLTCINDALCGGSWDRKGLCNSSTATVPSGGFSLGACAGSRQSIRRYFRRLTFDTRSGEICDVDIDFSSSSLRVYRQQALWAVCHTCCLLGNTSGSAAAVPLLSFLAIAASDAGTTPGNNTAFTVPRAQQ